MLTMMINNMIRDQREALRNEGEALEREKDQTLEANAQLANDYDIRLLKLIRKIIAHDRAYRGGRLTQDQRKANLCNIVKTVGLLTDTFQTPYNSNVQGYINANLWNDLAYLSKFKIGNPADPRINQPHDITHLEIVALLEGQCINTLDVLCEAEILAYSFEHGHVPIPPAHWVHTRTQNRAQYRDHRQIQELYIRVSHYREKEQLDKAIEAMQLAEGVILGAHIPEPENTIRKITVLRAFVILGEAATQKNLTPHTKALAPGLRNNDWQLFINIRNKLAHIEWDIHRRALDNYLSANDFRAIKAELPYIRDQYQQARLALIAFNMPQRINHYTTLPAVLPGPAANLLPNVRALRATLPAANNDRNIHPHSFTPVMMVNRIRGEVAALEAELLGCPLSTLDDVHNEDTTCMVNDSAALMVDLLREVNARSWCVLKRTELQTNLNTIVAYFTSRNEPLLLELPQGLFGQVVALSRTGQASNAEVRFNIIRQHVTEHLNEYREAMRQYRKKLDFVAALRARPTLTCISQHRIGRIGKFLAEIPNNVLDPLIGHMPRREIRALRNLVQHGHDAIDIQTTRTEEFLHHYLQFIMRRLLPALNPINPIHSFWDKNKTKILTGAVFTAGTFFVMYKILKQKNTGLREIPTLSSLTNKDSLRLR